LARLDEALFMAAVYLGAELGPAASIRDTAARIAEVLPNAKHTVLTGQDHGGPADVVTPVVADFFDTSLLEVR
jgi:hypothetical protein